MISYDSISGEKSHVGSIAMLQRMNCDCMSGDRIHAGIMAMLHRISCDCISGIKIHDGSGQGYKELAVIVSMVSLVLVMILAELFFILFFLKHSMAFDNSFLNFCPKIQ